MIKTSDNCVFSKADLRANSFDYFFVSAASLQQVKEKCVNGGLAKSDLLFISVVVFEESI